MYEDKTLVCKECGQEFVFTAGEQEFYAERGFANEPQRCKACRDARKNAARGPQGVFHRCLRRLRRRSPVPFEPSPTVRLLQRLLRQDAPEQLILVLTKKRLSRPAAPRARGGFHFLCRFGRQT